MIMAKEGRLCKRCRQDWPGFLRCTLPDIIRQALNRHVPRCTDPRVRWSPKYIVLCWVAMGWSLQRQLTERFREGNELLSALFPRRRRCAETCPGLTTACDASEATCGITSGRVCGPRFPSASARHGPGTVGSSWRSMVLGSTRPAYAATTWVRICPVSAGFLLDIIYRCIILTYVVYMVVELRRGST